MISPAPLTGWNGRGVETRVFTLAPNSGPLVQPGGLFFRTDPDLGLTNAGCPW